MQRGDRAKTMIRHGLEVAARLRCAIAQDVDPPGLLGIGQEGAVGHEHLRVMRLLPVVEKRLHVSPPIASNAAPSSIIPVSPCRGTKPMRS